MKVIENIFNEITAEKFPNAGKRYGNSSTGDI
jgi:hypothetical protein